MELNQLTRFIYLLFIRIPCKSISLYIITFIPYQKKITYPHPNSPSHHNLTLNHPNSLYSHLDSPLPILTHHILTHPHPKLTLKSPTLTLPHPKSQNHPTITLTHPHLTLTHPHSPFPVWRCTWRWVTWMNTPQSLWSLPMSRMWMRVGCTRRCSPCRRMTRTVHPSMGTFAATNCSRETRWGCVRV